jgi:hypothetical protein
MIPGVVFGRGSISSFVVNECCGIDIVAVARGLLHSAKEDAAKEQSIRRATIRRGIILIMMYSLLCLFFCKGRTVTDMPKTDREWTPSAGLPGFLVSKQGQDSRHLSQYWNDDRLLES